MVLKRCLSLHSDYINNIINHKFNVALFNGSLRYKTFKLYVIADAYYLRQLSVAWKNIANNIQKPEDKFFCMSRFDSELSSAVYLENKIKNENITQINHKDCTILIDEYASHIINSSSKYYSGLASILPCYYLYNRIGKEIALNKESNIYIDWINTQFLGDHIFHLSKKLENLTENIYNQSDNQQKIIYDKKL